MDRTMRRNTFARSALLLSALLASAITGAQSFTKADLEAMVKELETHATKNADYKWPIKCSVEDKAEVNAYATLEDAKDGEKPQTIMVVYSGLVKHFNGDKRLIRGVVAHEVSHLMLGHCSAPLWKARDLGQFWTRQQEMEADVSGAGLLVRCGYSRQDMVDMLMRLGEASPGYWAYKLTADHPPAAKRAAQVADDPTVYEALAKFDVARAFWDCRNFRRSSDLFSDLFAKEPKLWSAAVNAAATSLMYYYDALPASVTEQWFRPDFGPLLAPNPIQAGRGTGIGAEDRKRYQDALAKLKVAMNAVKDNEKVAETLALAAILNPDEDKAMIQNGIDYFEARFKEAKDDKSEILFTANNVAVGYQRLGNNDKALKAMMEAISATGLVNYILGENFSRLVTENEGSVGPAVMSFWLKTATPKSPHYKGIKGRYTDLCSKTGVKAEDVQARKFRFDVALSMVIDGKEIGLGGEIEDLLNLGGKPDKASYFDEKYKDLIEISWKGGDLQAFAEGNEIVRITSRLAGSSVMLYSADESVKETAKVSIGMSESELGGILNASDSVKKPLSKFGQPEEWTYYPQLNLGVLIENGKVAAITVTPAGRY